MRAIRILLAAVLLVWAPLSGALAAALGVSTAHHHCDNAWHGHAEGRVAAENPTDHHRLNVDPYSCDDCHIVMAAIPPAVIALEALPAAIEPSDTTAPAQHRVVISLFRPPRA
jgi:hypothetical protein